jgi:predicted Fe-S protein YdhL (DUF1289 family)
MEKIESPCIRFCMLDPRTHYCKGCARTLTEITQWTSYSTKERKAILTQLKQRPKSR